MEEAFAKIPVRSKKQAMDWSLALLSQGIESTIDDSEMGNGLGLIVATKDLETALKTLKQYKIENRHWAPWQQTLPWPEIRFDWFSVVWVVVLILFFQVSANNEAFRNAGWLDAKGVSSGQWWRLFTAMQLHANLVHLVSNLSIGVVLLGLAMGRYGTGVGLLAAYLAGTGGNVASFLIYRGSFHGLGASGMVMGALGLLAAQAFTWTQLSHKPKSFLIAGLAAGVLLFALFGMTPGTDMVAHFGGFVSGLIIGTFLMLFRRNTSQSAAMNIIAGVMVGLMVGLTWTLALLRAKMIS
jgi:rhomboid protease GluP